MHTGTAPVVRPGLVLSGLEEQLTRPPPEVVRRGGARGALEYLAALPDDAPAQRRRAALFMLVGDTGAGKTSLWRSLDALRPSADQVTHSTDGIAMHESSWTWDADGGDAMVSAWDYAGQDDYFLTHAFFLEHRCEHVLVWPAGGDEAKLLDWLEQLLSSVPLPQLMLVITRAADVPDAALTHEGHMHPEP